MTEVKAAGGVRTLDALLAVMALGVTRIGATATEPIIQDFRARQAGVPCHAIVGQRAITPFDVRILDLQAIETATTLDEIEAAGERLARHL